MVWTRCGPRTSSGAAASGLDAAPGLAAIATHRCPGSDIRLGDSEALPFADASFDAATLIHVGMNIENKPALFAGVRRVVELPAQGAAGATAGRPGDVGPFGVRRGLQLQVTFVGGADRFTPAAPVAAYVQLAEGPNWTMSGYDPHERHSA